MIRMLSYLGASIVFGLYCAIMVSSSPAVTATDALFTWVVSTGVVLVGGALARLFIWRNRRRLQLSDAQLAVEIRSPSVERTAQLRILIHFRPLRGTDKVNDVINRLTRTTPVFLYGPLIGLAVVYVVVMTTTFVLMDRTSGNKAPTNDLVAVQITYGAPMLLTLLAAFTAVVIWIRWKSTYLVLTNRRFLKVLAWPDWLPFTDKTISVPVVKLDITSPEQGFVGKLFGFGTFKTDTSAEKDEAIQVIRGVPDILDFVAELDALQPYPQR